MYLAETERMHVASDSSDTLEVWRHGHLNKAIFLSFLSAVHLRKSISF